MKVDRGRATGTGIGLLFGVVLGIAMFPDRPALGVACGVGIGVAMATGLGSAFDSRNTRDPGNDGTSSDETRTG